MLATRPQPFAGAQGEGVSYNSYEFAPTTAHSVGFGVRYVGAPTFFRRNLSPKIQNLSFPQNFNGPPCSMYREARLLDPERRSLSPTEETNRRAIRGQKAPWEDEPTRAYFSSPPSSEKSAMVVNSRSSSASSARRFFRTASSSAITITSTKN